MRMDMHTHTHTHAGTDTHSQRGCRQNEDGEDRKQTGSRPEEKYMSGEKFGIHQMETTGAASPRTAVCRFPSNVPCEGGESS